MKKLLISLAVISTLALSGCKKDVPCNCGTITNDEIFFDANGDMLYSLTIQNDCSGNLGTYYFSYDVWLNANVGEYFCISNVQSWMPTGPLTPVKKDGKTVVQ